MRPGCIAAFSVQLEVAASEELVVVAKVREKKLKVQMKKDGKKRAKMAAGKLPKRKGNKK